MLHAKRNDKGEGKKRDFSKQTQRIQENNLGKESSFKIAGEIIGVTDEFKG